MALAPRVKLALFVVLCATDSEFIGQQDEDVFETLLSPFNTYTAEELKGEVESGLTLLPGSIPPNTQQGVKEAAVLVLSLVLNFLAKESAVCMSLENGVPDFKAGIPKYNVTINPSSKCDLNDMHFTVNETQHSFVVGYKQGSISPEMLGALKAIWDASQT